jgi:hypothetical protein
LDFGGFTESAGFADASHERTRSDAASHDVRSRD